MRGRLAGCRIAGGFGLAMLVLALAACTGSRRVLDAAPPTTAVSPYATGGPISAQALAGRLGMNYTDADTHVLLADNTTRVRIWKDSEEVSVAGRTARMGERTSRRGRTLMVPGATAAYVQTSVGQSRATLNAPIRVARARPAVAPMPSPGRTRVPVATPISAPEPCVAATPKLAGAEPRWEPCGVTPRRWKWIVLHHSDDTSGDFAKYDRIHRLNNGWDECGYHFVIGNGSLSGDGQIEVCTRWLKQKHGAHAKTPDNRFNDYGVGICLVGDFETGGRPTAAQMDATVRLCRWLMARFDLPLSEVIGHCECKATACPGRYFPWDELRSRLSSPSM